MQFESNKGHHPFTGLFEGSDHGYIRMSLAKNPKKGTNTVPGFGLKFLRDGMDSANLVAMYSVDGQESWNYFANDFSNHIPAASPALQVLNNKFATYTRYTQTVGLSDFAGHTEAGSEVSNAVFPWSLRFHPTGQFGGSATYDKSVDWKTQLTDVPAGSTIYQVYGWDKPQEMGGKEYLIGNLVTKSEVTTTKWGDEELFFRHQDMKADLAIKPEWTQYTPYTGDAATMFGAVSTVGEKVLST